MKILQVSDGYGMVPSFGPIETVLFNISKQLTKMGNNVTILERAYNNKSPYTEYIDGIKIVRIDKRRATNNDIYNLNNPLSLMRIFLDGINFAIRFIQYIRINPEFDIIHSHLPFSSLILVCLKKEVRKKMVYTAHADEYRLNLSSRIKPQLILKIFSPDLFIMKCINKNVVLNELLRSKIIKHHKIKPEKIFAIPNGIDIGKNSSNKNIFDIERYNFKKGTQILFVGSIIKRKGVEYLIKAANIIINHFGIKKIKFLFVGKTLSKGPEANYFTRMLSLIEDFKLEKNVEFLGWIPTNELIMLYMTSDIFVLPSLEEGFGLVLPEAMMFGKPIIGTNIGGIPMQIKNGWNGFLVEPANEKKLAEKIQYMIENEDIRLMMGKNSRKFAENNFSLKSSVEKYLEIYKSIIE